MVALLNDLRETRGMIVIVIAHSKVERFEDPENSAYDRYTPRLHKSATSLLCEWADAVLFATKRFRGEHVPADLFGTPKPPIKYLATARC